MQRHEGSVAIANLLLLLLMLLRCGDLSAVPPYQGQGVQAYAQLLWGLWRVVEPPKIRFVRVVVLPSTTSMAVWMTFGLAVATRCFVFALRGAAKLIRCIRVAVAAAIAAVLANLVWIAYVFAVATAFLAMIPVIWTAKVACAWGITKLRSVQQGKKV